MWFDGTVRSKLYSDKSGSHKGFAAAFHGSNSPSAGFWTSFLNNQKIENIEATEELSFGCPKMLHIQIGQSLSSPPSTANRKLDKNRKSAAYGR
jgi:hypothetical protein